MYQENTKQRSKFVITHFSRKKWPGLQAGNDEFPWGKQRSGTPLSPSQSWTASKFRHLFNDIDI
jgi:hypothetical protein